MQPPPLDPLHGLAGWIRLVHAVASVIHVVRSIANRLFFPALAVEALGWWNTRHRSFAWALLTTVAFLWVVVAVEHRVGRTLQRTWNARAQVMVELVRRGERPWFVLLLRPFAVDGTLITTFERKLAADPLSLDLEVRFAYAVEGDAALISIAGQSRTFSSGRASLADAEWQTIERLLIDAAAMIIVIPGTTPSILWEIEEITRLGALARTLFVMPPRSEPTLNAARWSEIIAAAGTLGLSFPAYFDGGSLFRVDDDGVVRWQDVIPEGRRQLRLVARGILNVSARANDSRSDSLRGLRL